MRTIFGLLGSVLALMTACEAAPPGAPSQFSLAGSVPRKAATGAEAKLDSRLLGAINRLRGGTAPFSVRDVLDVDAEERVLVDITAKVTPDLLDKIRTGGGVVVSQFPRYDAIRAWVPVENLIPLAKRDEVRRIRPADRAVTR